MQVHSFVNYPTISTMDCPIETRVSKRRARNRERLLDAAEAMFTAGSYAEARIEEVADRADISVGTVYNYFGGKEGLYLAVTERVLDRVEAMLEPALAPELDAPTAVAMMGALYLQALTDNPLACRSLVSDALTAGEGVSAGARARIATLYDHSAAIIDRGIAAGTIAPTDSTLAARFLVGAWNGVFATSFETLAPRASLEEVQRTLAVGAELLLLGMNCKLKHEA